MDTTPTLRDRASRALTFDEIDALLWRVLAGEVPLARVPVPLLSWYWEGTRSASHEDCEHRIAIANAAADHWYLHATHTPEQIREMQLAAMDDGWREYWDNGMPPIGPEQRHTARGEV